MSQLKTLARVAGPETTALNAGCPAGISGCINLTWRLPARLPLLRAIQHAKNAIISISGLKPNTPEGWWIPTFRVDQNLAMNEGTTVKWLQTASPKQGQSRVNGSHCPAH